jgi:hypothetical protein
MRPRYVQALSTVLDLIYDRVTASEELAGSVSELKGMFNRCVRKDQADWYSVYKVLDCPTLDLAARLAYELKVLARALRDNNVHVVEERLVLLHKLGIERYLKYALAEISAATPTLLRALPTRSEPILQDVQLASTRVLHQRLSDVAKRKLKAASATHRATLAVLVGYLEAHGYQVEKSLFIDAYCRLKSGPAIFEIKSMEPGNELSQVRHALSQLYEYRFRHSLADASLWIVLSQSPSIEWITEYLEHDRNIRVLWVENGQLSGLSLELLLRSPRQDGTRS